MDEASLTVATTRHRDRMWLFAAREALETAEDTRQRGVPTEEAERTARVIGALGAHAAATAADANDTPVHDDFGRDPTRWHSPDPAEQTAAIEQEAEARRAREDLDRAQRVDPGRDFHCE